MRRNFLDLLTAQNKRQRYVCIGLDYPQGELPEPWRITYGDTAETRPQLAYTMAVVEATADTAAAYILNLHNYLVHGPEGYQTLIDTVTYLKFRAPDAVVVLDAKTGGGSKENEDIFRMVFEVVCADAITLHGYAGLDAMRPLLRDPTKGAFVLVRTSGDGAGEFQDLACQQDSEGPTLLWRIVARNVATLRSTHQNCGVEFGANLPLELRGGRMILGNAPMFLPNINIRSGSFDQAVRAAIPDGEALTLIHTRVVATSRGADFADGLSVQARALHNAIVTSLA